MSTKDVRVSLLPKPGEVLETEFLSEGTNKLSYVFKTHEDYRVVFVAGSEVFEDWRDTQYEAEAAAEDWVLSDLR